jgi:bacterioferritin-associated ferredoxin
VYYKDLEKIIQKSPAVSLKGIIRYTGASSSCGRCFGELQAAVKTIREENTNDSHRQLGLPFPEY